MSYTSTCYRLYPVNEAKLIMIHFIQQTKNWAEFRKTAKGEKYWEIRIESEDVPKIYGYLQKMPLPFNKSWLYCNRGPVINDLKEGYLTEFLQKTKEIAKNENAIFLRIEPPFIADSKDGKKYVEQAHDIGFKGAHASTQPEHTLIIDINQPEEEILAQMKQKGRYNIRLADKKGVRVTESEDIESFYKILKETTERDVFSGHNKEYYKNMIEILKKDDMAKLYIAEHEGETLAGIIVTFYNNMATYYYGASSNHKRNLMAPYLLQWHAMKEAKKRGISHYDMLGVAPPDAKNHPWEGVSQFKTKFGGQRVQYVKAQEYIFKPVLFGGLMMAKKIKRQ